MIARLQQMGRAATALFVAPVMALTGFRFSKDYRWGATRRYAMVYAMVNTVMANQVADWWAE